MDSSPTVGVTTSGEDIYISSNNTTEAKAIKVDNWITITNGDITITAADDGIKSEVGIEINGGLINIVDAVEGLEAVYLYVNDGELYINTTEDGMNATIGGKTESADDGSELHISGGYIYISSSADDYMDSNGTLTIAGGTIILHGPPSIMPPQGGLDANGEIAITGGYIIAAEVFSQESQIPDTSPNQNTVILNYNSSDPGHSRTFSAGTLFYIEGIYSPGTWITSFASTANVQQVSF